MADVEMKPGSSDKTPKRLPFSLAAFLFWVFVVLMLAWFIGLVIVDQTSDENNNVSPIVFFFPLWGVVGALLLWMWVTALRKRRCVAVLSYLEQAVRLELPLPSAIMASARGETGKVRRRLLSLAKELEKGRDLPDALAEAVPECDATTVAAVRSGMNINQLPRVLARVMERLLPRNTETTEITGFYRVYFLITMLLVVTMSYFVIQIFVFPKFVSILNDFHQKLPFWAEFLHSETVSAFIQYSMAALALGVLLFSFRDVREWITWRLPIIGPARRGQAMAELCAFMEMPSKPADHSTKCSSSQLRRSQTKCSGSTSTAGQRRSMAAKAPAKQRDPPGCPIWPRPCSARRGAVMIFLKSSHFSRGITKRASADLSS
jgi:hypothetical protein